jgi:hypothetical protein
VAYFALSVIYHACAVVCGRTNSRSISSRAFLCFSLQVADALLYLASFAVSILLIRVLVFIPRNGALGPILLK